MSRSFFCGLLLGLWLFAGGPAVAAVSNTIPLDSWVYPALEKLEGLDLIDSAMKGARPFSRLEAARQTREARAKINSSSAPHVATELLQRLNRFLDDELRGDAGGSYLKPLREVRLDYHYRSGADSAIAGTNARQFALNYNNDGIDFGEDHNGQLLFESEGRFGEFFLLSVRPLIKFQQGDDSASLKLLHGKAALGLGAFEVSVGRQSLWWGQGRHGSLVLTNNAKPFDMVRITNPSPVLLPWIFKHLGPFRFDVFWSELEKERVVPEPYFAGLRLQFKPLPWLEIGASRAVMFGGEGRPDVGWDDFLTILGGKNIEVGEDTSNSVAALDGRLRLPCLWGAEIYGEYGGEDEAGHFISLHAWLAGIYLPRIEPSGRLSLRLEYADLSEIKGNAAVWYRHGEYRSGYTYEQKILGHHVGGGGQDTYVELQMMVSKNLTLSLAVDFEQRGLDQDVTEKHTQGTLRAEWALGDHLKLDLRYGFDRVTNFDSEQGNDKNIHLASVGLHGSW